ncbi:ABC transporter substrate-binding protein [Catellatospora methionotrophica]|uniref:Endolytic murein transglycosylase n=1 Tax=Catellatospora methionotrophica TaxID=121620 RepID=A0A8J3LLG6_9ACTN|nr:endolytic transglycosylase MltG [Catellatospora methionotrophica]GIG17406.1 ABC transporter substrate-binding protein [Catellatospora methionotrophica]
MIDELDRAFDDDHDGDPRQELPPGEASRQRRRFGRMRSVLAMCLALVLLGALGVGAVVVYKKISGALGASDWATSADGTEVQVEIKSGDTQADIARTLKAAGVIASEKAFVEAGERNPDALRIQPGFYKMRTHMSAKDAVLRLLDLKNRIVNGITIPEGLSSFRVFKLLAAKTGIAEADFRAAAEDPLALGVPDWWFNRTDDKKVTPSVEGFLFPDTYEFAPNATAESMLRVMVNRFLTVTGSMNFADTVPAELGGIAPYEALIVASLAQAEAGNADDFGKVARVAYNRVYKRIPDLTCACFQFDVTVNYSRELAGKDPKPSSGLSHDELTDAKNPYNRNAEGMIPTPINNPGKAALEGAMSPPKGDWYYFVATDRQGHSAFSETFEEFCQDNETAVKNKVLQQSSC